MTNRRQFLQTSAGAAALLALRQKAWAFYQSSPIQLWQTTFRNAGAIPVALWDGYPGITPAPITGVKHYTINIEQFQDQLLPGTGTPTTLWGFKPTKPLGTNPAHLGGIIVAKKGEPIQITFKNNLPAQHIIPVDQTIPGANQALNRHPHPWRVRAVDQRWWSLRLV